MREGVSIHSPSTHRLEKPQHQAMSLWIAMTVGLQHSPSTKRLEKPESAGTLGMVPKR